MNLDISTENLEFEGPLQEPSIESIRSRRGAPHVVARADLLQLPSIPRPRWNGTPHSPALDPDDAVLRGLLIHEYLTEGRSVKAVAERLGIGVTSAKAALRANGIPIRRAGGSARAVPRDTDHQLLRHVLIQEYVTDERSARSVAARLGIGTKAVLAALRATDIPVRQAGGRARRPRDPETAGFLSLATEWHAYWCGYLLALRPYRSSLHPHRFRIRAHLEDLPHLENLRVGLDSDAPIRTRSHPRRGDACFLQIESPSLAEALAPWSITPTSWAAARWPRDVPPLWRAAHLRGYLEAAALPAGSRAGEGFTVSALGSSLLGHDLRNCLAELHIPVAGFARVSPGRGAVHLSLERKDADRLFGILYATAAVWNPSARRRISERLLLTTGEHDRSESPRHPVEPAIGRSAPSFPEGGRLRIPPIPNTRRCRPLARPAPEPPIGAEDSGLLVSRNRRTRAWSGPPQ